MTEKYAAFLATAEEKLVDYQHKDLVYNNNRRYNSLVTEAKKQFSNLTAARERAAFRRWKTFENLDKYLIEFEANFNKTGGKLVWAQNSLEALNEILKILHNRNITTIVKSKTSTASEIKLYNFLKENNIECFDSDLGDFILQISDDTASHMVTPAMHKSLKEIRTIFKNKFNVEGNPEAEELSVITRHYLREKFLKAGAAITGANFLIADTGSVSLTENEGNIFMGCSFSNVHIVIAGIDKIIPSLYDLDLFNPLLASYGTGQEITAYNSLVTGPRRNGEKEGTGELFLVLLDNGRSNLLAKTDQRNAINCIHCGSCLTACPVYNQAGGHAWHSLYKGPIGSVVMPHLQGEEEFKHLSFASTICGKCTQSCPVNINLHELLLYNRRDFAPANSKSEKMIFYFWKKAMMKREVMNKGGQKTKNFLLMNFFRKSWGKRREMPRVASKSFNELWRETMKV